jgi:hypothetical protein
LSSGGDPDWLLRDLRGQAGSGYAAGFEVALLDGLFGREPAVRLSELGEPLIPGLNRFRAQLRREAVRRGWMRRWHDGTLTPRGEELLRRTRDFRRELRMLAAAGDSEALAALAPYAMIFGLMKSPVGLSDISDPGRDRLRDSAVQWSQYDRFARSWLGVCAQLPVVSGHGSRSAPSQPGDFGSHGGGSHTGAFSQGGHTGH